MESNVLQKTSHRFPPTQIFCKSLYKASAPNLKFTANLIIEQVASRGWFQLEHPSSWECSGGLVTFSQRS